MSADEAKRKAARAHLEYQDRTDGGWYASDLNSRRLIVMLVDHRVVEASIG